MSNVTICDVSHSYREGVTKAARQRDVLRVGETRLQGQLALGRGDQVGVGEAELHREPVLCSYHPSYKIVSSNTGRQGGTSPWRRSRGRRPGACPRPRWRGPR